MLDAEEGVRTDDSEVKVRHEELLDRYMKKLGDLSGPETRDNKIDFGEYGLQDKSLP